MLPTIDFSIYLIFIAGGFIAGVLLVRDLDKSSREARLAFYDLIWLLFAPVIGFLVTFSAIGEKSWDEHVRFADSLRGIQAQHIANPIKKTIANDFCNKSEIELRSFLGNRKLEDLPDKVCSWAKKLDAAVVGIALSKQAVVENCTDTPLHQELKVDLFAKGKSYCGAASEVYGLCGQSYCKWSQQNFELQQTLSAIPIAIDQAYPPLAPILEAQRKNNYAPELNQDSRKRLVPIERYDYFGWLVFLCFILGLRLTKALSDFFYKSLDASSKFEKYSIVLLGFCRVFKCK